MTSSMISSGGGITTDALNGAFREILERYGDIDTIDADESTSSLTFTDLATRGPEVSLSSRGTRAIVFIACRNWNTTAAANINAMGVQVSDRDGQVVHAASISGALMDQGFTTRIGAKRRWICLPFGLGVPGEYTYRAMYSARAGTSVFGNRSIAVFAP